MRTIKEAVEDLERRALKEALEKYGGDRQAAQHELGLSAQGMMNKLRKYGYPATPRSKVLRCPHCKETFIYSTPGGRKKK